MQSITSNSPRREASEPLAHRHGISDAPIQETGKRPTAALDRNLAYLGLVESCSATRWTAWS